MEGCFTMTDPHDPNIILPVTAGITEGPVPLAYGLHLMAGVKASGKTVSSLALVYETLAADKPARYEYVMEPRSRFVSSLVGEQGAWQKHLVSAMGRVKGGILVADSLTYLIDKLDKSVEMEEELSRVTYSGGLSPRDIMGVLFHDELARKHEIALVGTLNAELFPVIDKLGGACEGEFQLAAPGSFQHRDRSTRSWKTVALSSSAMTKAFNALNYKVQSGYDTVNRY
jgi:hypothetical protein